MIHDDLFIELSDTAAIEYRKLFGTASTQITIREDDGYLVIQTVIPSKRLALPPMLWTSKRVRKIGLSDTILSSKAATTLAFFKDQCPAPWNVYTTVDNQLLIVVHPESRDEMICYPNAWSFAPEVVN